MDFLDQPTLHRCCLCLRATLPEIEFQGQQFRRSVETGRLGRIRVVHWFDHKLSDSNHMGMHRGPRGLES